MTNGVVAATTSSERSKGMRYSALPALFVATGFALAYAGVLAARLLGVG